MSRGSKDRLAFSLLESLIALALTVLLLGAAFAFLFNLGTRRDDLLRRARTQRGVVLVLERLEADLLCSLVEDGFAGVGIKGDRHSLTVLTRSVDANISAQGEDGVDILRCSYGFNGSAGSISYSRHAVDYAENESPSADKIAGGIADFEIRYFDGRNWSRSFDSRASEKLPCAVEVGVWIGRPRDTGFVGMRSPPDVLRVISIADAPAAAWKEGE